jgi:hypothetical protein
MMLLLFFTIPNVVCGFLSTNIISDTKHSFSSFSLIDPVLEGLPYDIEVKGDDPTSADLNETLLYTLMEDSYDESFMKKTRPRTLFRKNTGGECVLKRHWKKQPKKLWPRWIQTRTCYEKRFDLTRSGNSCYPSRIAIKSLLWFHCYFENNVRNCSWMPVRYPFITKCSKKKYFDRSDDDMSFV